MLDEFDWLQDPSLLCFIQDALKGLIKPEQFILTTSTYKDLPESLEKVCKDFSIDRKSLTVINHNKVVTVVGNLTHYYVFVPSLHKDYYFFHVLQKELEKI